MAESEYAYPSDLDSDEGSIFWEDDNELDDSFDANSLTSRLNRLNVGTSQSDDSLPSYSPPPGYQTPNLCVFCNRKPIYSRNGKTYVTCGLTCAAALQELQSRRAARGSSTRTTPAIPRAGNAGLDGQTRAVRVPVPPPRPQCVVCKERPSFHKRVTCGLKCAEKLIADGGDATMCNYCHRRKKHADEPQCGTTCAEKAKVACLLCRCRPRNGRYHLCGKFCMKISVKQTPLLLEAPRGHATFEMVEKKFKSSWKAGSTPCPEIKKVFKIIENEDFLRPYNAYRGRVKNEHFRYHGTARQCNLGKDGTNQTKVCASTTCSICNILKTSFKVSLAKASGAFGAGVYSSSASNKAFSYCGAGGTMLLTKVVLGNIKTVTGWNEVMACPAGYDSVVFDRMNGTLNETIVYSDDAIRPVFLLTF